MSAAFTVTLDTSAPNATISSPRWMNATQLEFLVDSDEPLESVSTLIEMSGVVINSVYYPETGRIVSEPVSQDALGGTVTIRFTDDVLNPGASSLSFTLRAIELRGRLLVYRVLNAAMKVYSRVSAAMDSVTDVLTVRDVDAEQRLDAELRAHLPLRGEITIKGNTDAA